MSNLNTFGAPSPAADHKSKLAYIDCLRGYAVLLVIATHTVEVYRQMPYPVHKLATFGWHGVQLFFVASCMTLLMSARSERARTGEISLSNFFIRRFLRIAPMYYLAAGLYFLIRPPAQVSLAQLLASFAFVNAWHPVTTGTTGAWQVVPGGWSIGVEFTFYLVFPLFLAVITSWRRAGLLLAASVALAALLNTLLMPILTARYGYRAADNFLYFWPVNQAPVFVIGALSYFAVAGLEARPASAVTIAVRRWAGMVIGAALLLLFAVAWFPKLFSHQFLLTPQMPQYFAATLAFALFAVGMSQARRSILINPVIAKMGQVSFSAYLLQFAVIIFTLRAFPHVFRTDTAGWQAIAAFGVGMVLVTGLTYIAASITYAFIEQPFMRYAKQLTARPLTRAVATP